MISSIPGISGKVKSQMPLFRDDCSIARPLILKNPLDLPAGALQDFFHFYLGDEQVVEPWANDFVVPEADTELSAHASTTPVEAMITGVQRIGG